MSVAVMAHPARAGFVDELAAALDREPVIVWDRGHGPWDTGRRAWEAHDPDATHHLVLQDDAVVCRDLAAGLEAALAHVPAGHPVSLYLGTGRPHPRQVARMVADAPRGTSWMVTRALCWGVAACAPTALIGETLAFVDHIDQPAYDQRLGRWWRRQGLDVWHPWPSLVDHRDQPSLLPWGRNAPPRRAHLFAGADASALDVDYSGPAVTLRL